jgi:hypothetical protein
MLGASTMTQKGQAMVETMFVLLTFVIFLLSVSFTQKISDRSSELLNHGLSTAISSARGATLSVVRHGENRNISGHSFNNNKNLSMDELGTSSNIWSIAELHDKLIIPTLLQQKDIDQTFTFHSSVMVRGLSTHANDSDDVVTTLNRTKRLWGKPAAMTRHLSSVVKVQAHLTDAAWKRPGPKQNFLADWKEITP